MDINETIGRINRELPIHNMWDGFWVHSWYNGDLVISCSFDRLLYRNYDITFRGVTFFNLPARWDDTEIGDELLRPAQSNFEWDFEDFVIDEGKFVFGIDMYIARYREVVTEVDGTEKKEMQKYHTLYTFYIVADDVVMEKCLQGNTDPWPDYKEPLKFDHYPCMENRVPHMPRY